MKGEDLTQLIKQMAVDAVQSSGPLEVMTGKAVNVDRYPEPDKDHPIESTALISFQIQVSPDLILDRDFFTLAGEDLYLQGGERFVLLRKQGNGPFIAIREGAFK